MVLVADSQGLLHDLPAAPPKPTPRSTESAAPPWPLPIGEVLRGKTAVEQLYAFEALFGVEALAAAANALHEGASGAIGDNGHAFGPWQEWLLDGRIAGADDRWVGDQQPNRWAWTGAGFRHAFEGMVAGGARGKHGHAAIRAIVYGFEKPHDEATAYAVRSVTYDQLVKMGAAVHGYLAGRFDGPPSGGPPPKGPPPPPPSVRGEPLIAEEGWGRLRDRLGKTLAPSLVTTRDFADSLVGLVTIPRG